MKWCGNVGYAESKETVPGVWEDVITERFYAGDLLRNTRRLQSGDHVNDDINISNQISFVADPYAYQNFHLIQYVEFMGTCWKVSSIDASQYPRLVLELGGVYNGPKPEKT